MTLAHLQSVETQVQKQYRGLLSTPADKQTPNMRADALQCLGALQLLKQLIAAEMVELQSPPGPTGPDL